MFSNVFILQSMDTHRWGFVELLHIKSFRILSIPQLRVASISHYRYTGSYGGILAKEEACGSIREGKQEKKSIKKMIKNWKKRQRTNIYKRLCRKFALSPPPLLFSSSAWDPIVLYVYYAWNGRSSRNIAIYPSYYLLFTVV